MGARGSLLLFVPRGSRCSVASHGCRNPPLFFRRELEDVIGQQLAMIFVVALERWRRRTRKNPLAILLLLEYSRWHRRSWADALRIGHPALHPVRHQSLLCQQ